MLPSTGYFKGINCPFYDSGLCERPYCHFRHVKKDSINSQNDGIESGSMLQKLVSAAVQKVLQQTEISAVASSSQTAENDTGSAPISNAAVHSVSKATYNPTPISELKKNISLEESEAKEAVAEQRKRHIPVPYTPRKPASLPTKRALKTNGSSEGEPLIYLPPPPKYKPGSSEGSPLDPYLPKGSAVSAETYQPGTPKDLQEYAPTQTQVSDKCDYIPSGKKIKKKRVLEYSPVTATNKHQTVCVKYEPTPRSQVPCFSSDDDDEPEPKKSKLCNDLNDLDDLGAEFDMLTQILNEENLDENHPVKCELPSDLETEHSKKEDKPIKNINTEVEAKDVIFKEEKVDIKDKPSSHKREKSSRSKSKSKSEGKSNKRDEMKIGKDDQKVNIPQNNKNIKGKHEDGTNNSPQRSDHCKPSSKISEKQSDPSRHSSKNSEKLSDPSRHSSKNSEKQSDPSSHSSKNSEKQSDPSSHSSKNSEKQSDPSRHSSKNSEKQSDPSSHSSKNSEKPSNPSRNSSKNSEKQSDPSRHSSKNSEQSDPSRHSRKNSEKQSDPSRNSSNNSEKQSDPCRHLSKNSEKQSEPSKHSSKNSEKQSDPSRHSSKNSEKQSDPSRHSSKISRKKSDSSKDLSINSDKYTDPSKHSIKISEKHSEPSKHSIKMSENHSNPSKLSIKISEKHSETGKQSSKISEKHFKSRCRNSTNSKSSKTSSSSKSHNGHSSRSSKEEKTEKRKHQKHKESKERHSKDKLHNLSDGDDNFDDRSGLPDDDLVSSSESDEESRALECKKIFEEYIPAVKSKSSVPETENVSGDIEEMQYVPGKIRISRTIDKNIKVQPKVPIKPDYKVNAAQAMNDRLAKVREYHASRNITPPETSIPSLKPEQVKSTPTPVNSNSSKVRIAHVSYASTMINVKKSLTPTAGVTSSLPSTSTTIVQTVKKGVQRTAHIPNDKFIDRPGVLEPLASKIPANIRSIYLNMMIDECLKIYIYPTDAYARAQYEELNTSKKCSKVQIYKNSAVLTVTRLRKEIQECNGVKKTGSECSALQRGTQAASGNSNTLGSWSIENKSRGVTDSSKEFRGAKFYNNISKWILTEEQLQENGFPRPHPSRERGRAIIFGQNKQKPPQGLIRTCCRCKKEFTVDKKGFPAVQQECIYHPNNKYRYRGEAKYQCCSQDGMSDGCCVAPCHVWEYVDHENLKGYVSTLPPEREMEDYGVYSLDCEMCYTTHGLDLTRITVVDSNCKVVYETLIQPIHPIIDYNTRYSGITEEQMANVNTTLIEVQATLLTMFNSKTILIGHSLESDFKALKLIHGTVVDTSVLFPHKMGPPFKRALRNLSSEYLKKIIQNSVDGHDSAEDATVCMELVTYKLKETLKTR